MAFTQQSPTHSADPTESVFPESGLDVAIEICPLCEQPIPSEKLVEIQQRERERAEAQEEQLRAEFRREKADLEKQLETVKGEQERVAAERVERALAGQRASLEQASIEAVQKEQSKAFDERQKLLRRLDDLQRQLTKERADELGEAAELDLGEVLRENFTDDHFHAIAKGIAGADLWQDVKYNGQVCGRIVYDSKNRNAWRNDYVSKLKIDQLNADGDYAVLATRAFPAGCKQMQFQDGVLVVHPARVLVVVTILREQLIQMNRLQLSHEQRDTKSNALYEFITSERCHQIFEHFETLTNDMLELDVKETKQHQVNWKKRGELIKKAERAILIQLRDQIERIIETEDGATS